MKKTIGKSTTEVIKTLAYQYKRRKDQLDTLSTLDRNNVKYLVIENFDNIGIHWCEFISDKEAKEYHNVDLNDYNQVGKYWKEQGVMLISSDNNNSPLMIGETNLMFRAWHDYIHFTNSYPFDFVGEFLTWEKHCEKGCSSVVKKVLFSEIVLQACYFLTFGKFPEIQKVILLEDYYIDLATELVYFNSPKN